MLLKTCKNIFCRLVLTWFSFTVCASQLRQRMRKLSLSSITLLVPLFSLFLLPRSSSLFSSSRSPFYLITSIFCYATITVILRSCPSSTTNHSHSRYHRPSYLWRWHNRLSNQAGAMLRLYAVKWFKTNMLTVTLFDSFSILLLSSHLLSQIHATL